jgi:high-affinity iron transporter
MDRNLMRHIFLAALLAFPVATMARCGEVAGRVIMPEVCAPAVSPAVAALEPASAAAGSSRSSPTPSASPAGAEAEVALINQQGLQFVPRVQAIALGQTVQFTNADTETHNVHIGNDFNASMSPGQPRSFTPPRPGVYTLLCDVHSHMRGYLIVADTPWVGVCTRQGRFEFENVPAGRYVLTVWHEMGPPVRKEVIVAGGEPVDLGTIAVTAPAAAAGRSGTAAPVLPWSQVIEKIGLLLASSLDAAVQPDGLKGARKLAEDAYWGEFEASDMETAVRTHLGFARAGELEDQFRAMVAGVRDVAAGRQGPEHATELSRKLLLGLLNAAADLNRKGVTDRAHVLAGTHAPAATAPPAPAAAVFDAAGRDRGLSAVQRGLARVEELANRGEAEEAAAEMTAVYWGGFEPLERFIAARMPQDVRPLEARFSTIRGEVGAGLKGKPLAATLALLQTEVKSALDRSAAEPAGTFGPAFAASLVTIVREGVEVILVLAMLIALATRTGASEGEAGGQARTGALRAIAWGVALAVVASLGTALGLNLLVASAQGRTRELFEGLVMLLAAGVLFYVSYWLISQSESRRWLAFLKRQAERGLELGGRGALALTAFLAVYREGAETALMYQAMLGSQGQSRAGLLGLAAGLVVGLLVLAAVALVVRATSIRLPLRAFFQFSGAVLFGMAVVFAGNAIFELQQCGLLKTTHLSGPGDWLGPGIPMLGLYPNVQTLSIQALLLAGAVLAMLLMLTDRPKAGVRPQA